MVSHPLQTSPDIQSIQSVQFVQFVKFSSNPFFGAESEPHFSLTLAKFLKQKNMEDPWRMLRSVDQAGKLGTMGSQVFVSS